MAANLILISAAIGLAFVAARESSVGLSPIHFGCGLAFWSLVEYVLHRFVLHGALTEGPAVRREHSIQHHRYFDFWNMEWREPVDLNRVFLYPKDLAAVLAGTAAIAVAAAAFGPEIAVAALASGVAYVLIYECVHGLAHADLGFAAPLFEPLVRAHRLHHHPAVQEKGNFAVVAPVWDRLFGTRALRPPAPAPGAGVELKALVPGAPEHAAYRAERDARFPHLRDEGGGSDLDVAAFVGQELVGGLTLRRLQGLACDAEVTARWEVLRDGPATRVLRLWTKPQWRRAGLARLLLALLEHESEATFVYGILSVPAEYARAHAPSEVDAESTLRPLVAPPEDARFAAASSEGRRLAPFYLGVGARFLGPAAVCPRDGSVRIALGMSLGRADAGQATRLTCRLS